MTSTTKVNAVKNFNLRSEREINTPLNHFGSKFHSHLRELKNKDKSKQRVLNKTPPLSGLSACVHLKPRRNAVPPPQSQGGSPERPWPLLLGCDRLRERILGDQVSCPDSGLGKWPLPPPPQGTILEGSRQLHKPHWHPGPQVASTPQASLQYWPGALSKRPRAPTQPCCGSPETEGTGPPGMRE